MNIVDLVNSMGGVENVLSQPLQPVSRTDLILLFDINDNKFIDYIDYLEHFGGNTSFKKLYEPVPYSRYPQYCYPPDKGVYNRPYSGTHLATIYGEGSNYNGLPSISHRLKKLEDRIPKGFLPIARDTIGDTFLMAIDGENKGSIYFWDSDNDPDPDEYFEMHNEVMPEKVRMQNMYCVGKNFYDFIARMELSSDNDE